VAFALPGWTSPRVRNRNARVVSASRRTTAGRPECKSGHRPETRSLYAKAASGEPAETALPYLGMVDVDCEPAAADGGRSIAGLAPTGGA
jgi:hypothetical protein